MHRLCLPFFVLAALVLARLPAPAGILSGSDFVVDPGHGARFADRSPLNVGAVGPSGVAEEQVVLDVSEDLAKLLRAAGAQVELTRSHSHPFRIATDRAKDNRARAFFANARQATAFMAIHADGSLDRSQRGTSVFWLHDNSTQLANAVRKRLQPLGLGESQFRRRHLAVTEEAKVPAVLVEIGFVSNPQQAHLLASAGFQQRIAAALFAALVDVFGQR